MIKDLEMLMQLQAIDVRIVEIKRSSEEFPRMAADLEAAVVQAQQKVDAATQKMTELEGEKKNVLSRHTDAEAALKKSEERLNSIKTNREYDAVHAEIEAHKHTIETTQSKVATFDAGITAAQTARDELLQALEKTKTENEPKVTELKAKIATFDSQISEVTKEREVVVPQISKNAIRIYEHILKKRKNGQVMATIRQGHRNCSVCNKVLESQLVNEIRKGDRLQTCQSCGSILVWITPPDSEAAPAA